MNYRNPVIPGFYPDPSICRVGGDYYLATSSFEYFPGVPLFHSRDLVNWRQIGHCLTRKSQLNLEQAPCSGGIYAPTLRYHDGLYYMTTTNVSGGGHFYVWTDHPENEWSDPIWVDQPGIDPDLFFDESGEVYFTSAAGEPTTGIYQSKINIKTGERLTDYKIIWTGSGGRYPEAPHLYKKDGYYYLMLAEGGTEYGHMVTIARSRHPEGPFEACPDNPILSHRSLYSSIQATGHADLVETEDGQWRAVFLGIRPLGNLIRHHLGRETYLSPAVWETGAWPVIGEQGRVHEIMELPGEEPAPWEEEETRDDFNRQSLRDPWNFLRNPREASWSLDQRPGWLTLRGSEITLNDIDSPAFIGRRQQHFQCSARTLLEFEPLHEGEEAGLTVLMNNRFHYEIALTRSEGQTCLIFRRRVGSLSREEFRLPWSSRQVILGVDADREEYHFHYAAPGGEAVRFGAGECALLATEVTGGFTGVYIGLYATGNGKLAEAEAHFDWFEYNGNDEQSI